MSKNDIRLHKQYGVNPTIPTCFFCGKPKNEVALLGASYPKQAPMHMIVDLEPCDEYKAGMAQGTTLLGTSHEPVLQNQPTAGKDDAGRPVYLTGSMVVLSEHGVRALLDKELADEIIQAGSALMDDKAVRAIASELSGDHNTETPADAD